MELSSSQGCRFCRAKSDELCRQSGSGWMESLRLFWKASCCSCSMSRLACCRSASRSSAVCRLHPGRERDSTVTHWALLGHQRAPALPGTGQPSPSRRRAARCPPAHTFPEARGVGGRVGPLGFVCTPRGRCKGTLPAVHLHTGFCGFANNKSCFFCVFCCPLRDNSDRAMYNCYGPATNGVTWAHGWTGWLCTTSWEVPDGVS